MDYLTMADCPAAFKNSDYFDEALRRIARRSQRVGDCIECSLSINDTGYSTIRFGGRMWRTHRLKWFLERGHIEPDMTLDHLCKNRKCCNLDHLEVVTLAENSARATKGQPAIYAKRRAQTHCKRGHEYQPRDVRPDGSRNCQECHRITRKAIYDRDPVTASRKSAERSRKARERKMREQVVGA